MPTFDVPGTPYSIAKPNLIILEHVQMSKVLPLRLNKHTTAAHTHRETRDNRKWLGGEPGVMEATELHCSLIIDYIALSTLQPIPSLQTV